MKYRIVETEAGTYRIQKSLFGLIWFFVKEKRYKNMGYSKGFCVYSKAVYDYKTQELAEQTLERIKSKISYKNYNVISCRDQDGYLAYLIPNKPNKKIFPKYTIIKYDLEEINDFIDIMDTNRIHDKNVKKIKRILA